MIAVVGGVFWQLKLKEKSFYPGIHEHDDIDNYLTQTAITCDSR